MKQGRVIINMKYYTTSSTGEIGFYSFFLLFTSVIFMEAIVGNQLISFLQSCRTLIKLSLICAMQQLCKSTSIYRLLYTIVSDYVIETNSSYCTIILSSPYKPIIVTNKRPSIFVIDLSKYEQQQLIMYQRIISWPMIICNMLTLLCMVNDDQFVRLFYFLNPR